MGRWCSVTIHGKGKTGLTIITGYRVCAHLERTAGIKTAYMQQYACIRGEGIKAPNPRRRFVQDLKKVVRQKRIEGNEVVVLFDENEEWEEGGENLKDEMEEVGLYHVVLSKYDKVPTSRPQKSPRKKK